MKFFFQIPLHRMAMIMRMQGLDVSEGALTGMLKKLAPLFLPLYLLLTEVNRSENHWHVDEPAGCALSKYPISRAGTGGLRVFVSPLTVVFVLDPSRGSQVPLKHFGKDARGIMNCDRLSAYGKLADMIKGLVRALCWAHYRRDFVNAGKSLNCLKDWADLWVNRIALNLPPE